MTEKEKEVQRALGTLPMFSVKIKIDLIEATRQDALAKSRAMLKVLRREFPECEFVKNTMKNMN